MKHMMKRILILGGVLILALALALPALAAGEPADGGSEGTETVQAEQADNTVGFKSIASGLAIGIAAGGGGIGMGLATARAAEGISRQPEAENKIRTMMMLGLVFIETAIIYALLVVILIIFVL